MKPTLFALLVGLQCVDVAMTLYAIKRGAVETNKALLWLQERLGKNALLVAKLGFVALVAWQYAAIPVEAFAGLCAFYALIVWNNWKAIRRQRDQDE